MPHPGERFEVTAKLGRKEKFVDDKPSNLILKNGLATRVSETVKQVVLLSYWSSPYHRVIGMEIFKIEVQ